MGFEVIREEQGIILLRENQVVMLNGRRTAIQSQGQGGKEFPIGEEDFLGTEFVGKKDNRDEGFVNTHLPNPYNV